MGSFSSPCLIGAGFLPRAWYCTRGDWAVSCQPCSSGCTFASRNFCKHWLCYASAPLLIPFEAVMPRPGLWLYIHNISMCQLSFHKWSQLRDSFLLTDFPMLCHTIHTSHLRGLLQRGGAFGVVPIIRIPTICCQNCGFGQSCMQCIEDIGYCAFGVGGSERCLFTGCDAFPCLCSTRTRSRSLVGSTLITAN